MSQYKTGTATVTNGSATVTGTNTLWLANVTSGDSFTVAGDGVMYYVASVDSDTQITLSVAYAGTTASGAVYAIGTGFTVPDSFPEMSQGDIETATIFTRAMRKIQGKFSSILAGGSDANFTSMPQVGGDPIVESGSNSDGEWTRWADGTQIISNSVATSNTATATWTYPVSFISGTYRLNSMVQASGSALIATVQSKALASIGVNCWEGISTTLERRVNTLDITATGRWK